MFTKSIPSEPSYNRKFFLLSTSWLECWMGNPLHETVEFAPEKWLLGSWRWNFTFSRPVFRSSNAASCFGGWFIMTLIQRGPVRIPWGPDVGHECPHRGAVRFRRGRCGNSAASDRHFPVTHKTQWDLVNSWDMWSCSSYKKTTINIYIYYIEEIPHWCRIYFVSHMIAMNTL